MYKFQDWYGQVEFCSLPLPRQYIRQRHWSRDEIDWTSKKSHPNEYIYWVTLTLFLSGALYWMKQLFITKVNFIRKGCYLPSERFRTFPQSKIYIFPDCIRKNLFLSAYYCWDGTFSLRVMDRKFLHGGKIGYGDSNLDSVFLYSELQYFQTACNITRYCWSSSSTNR